MYNHQLDAFVQAAESGSFGKAAEALYISAPALIQQINLLEERCGLRLFVRINHGAALTPAGESFYQDAKAIIRMSHDALQRARALVSPAETTVRVATSLLFKCRLLPGLWTEVRDRLPGMKLEILPMEGYRGRQSQFAQLGVAYDLWEAVYGTEGWDGLCGFLELECTPICCAVAKGHRLAGQKRLSMQDLNGEYLYMPVRGVSKEMDAFRLSMQDAYPTIQTVDSVYYGMDIFTKCERNRAVLITHPVYADIHTNLVAIAPVTPVTPVTLPYGLVYAKHPPPAFWRR